MIRRTSLTVAFAVFLASLVVVVATSGQEKKASPSTAAPAGSGKTLSGKPPAKDDTAVLFYVQDPDTFNALNSNDTVSEELLFMCYERLAQRRYDDPNKWEARLAESWSFDPEKLEYTIRLRKGVMWHPMELPGGQKLPATEFTARDVKFTFDCLLNKHIEASHHRSYYEDPEAKDESQRYKIKVSLVPGDKYTVKIRWSKPYFLMDDWSLSSIFIIPRHVYSVDEKGEPISLDVSSKEFADGFNSHWANTKACGTGPMIFKRWIKDRQFEFERNPNYWGAPFYFSKVIYRTNTNRNTVLQQTLQNEYDFARIIELDHYVQVREHPNVASGKVALETFFHSGYRYLGYNLNREFFKDKRVRWALGHAVPVDTIIEKVFHNLAERVTGPFQLGSPTNDTSIKPLEFDLDKSRKLLDEAGWKDTNGDGVRDKMIDGQRVNAAFELMIYSDATMYQIIAEIIKENCRKIGVEVRIDPVKWALMLQKLRKKEFDATMLGWSLDWKQDPFQVWHGSQADLPDTSNHISYKNPELDRLIEKLRITIDEAEQIKLCHQIHRLIYDDQALTFLFADKYAAGRDPRLQNVKFSVLRPCYDPRQWFATSPRMAGP